MALDQQGQDCPFARWGDGGGRWDGQEGLLKRLASTLHPGVERLARDAQLTAELGDDAIVAGMGDHLADNLNALGGRAIMALDHCVPLKGWLC
jgi:hypothetical protein